MKHHSVTDLSLICPVNLLQSLGLGHLSFSCDFVGLYSCDFVEGSGALEQTNDPRNHTKIKMGNRSNDKCT